MTQITVGNHPKDEIQRNPLEHVLLEFFTYSKEVTQLAYSVPRNLLKHALLTTRHKSIYEISKYCNIGM
jgi:hypothetical protein